MPAYSDQAVVLARVDYSETSQVLALFTREHGKVRAIAKGIKRSTKTRFTPAIDLLDIGSVVFTARSEAAEALATLTEWKHAQSLVGLRDFLPRIYAGLYVGEVTANLTEDWDPHPELYDCLVRTLAGLAVARDVLPLVVGYQRSLLEEAGLMPRLDACVFCARTTQLTHFTSHQGGVVCRNCEGARIEKRQLAPHALDVLRSDPIEGTATALAGAFDVLNYHIAHLMGRQPALADKLIAPADSKPRRTSSAR